MNTLTVIERENQRVMTTAVLAEEYGTTERRISENFNANKERYIEGKHFYCLEGEALKEFKANTEITEQLKYAPKIYLWTEKGAFLHAKSLNTDRAWEIYDVLVDTYFKKQEVIKPLSSIEIMELSIKAIKDVDNKVDAVNEDLQSFKLDLPLLGVECDRITSAVRSKGVKCLGGKESPAYKDKSLRGKVYSDIHRELKRQFGLSSYKGIKRNQCDLAVEIINNYELPHILSVEVEEVNSQIMV
nr:MAG TPA: hypothetical protein [Caudoviricetes sp.]